ncbi:MAG: AmmeMemoRadiSam system protein B, partial [Chromatiales bacterium]
DVDRFLADARPGRVERPKALIAPHAGYVYSGPVAAQAYAQLASERAVVERVVILAPAHRYPFRGLARSTAEAFRTPLGEVPVDAAALRSLDDLPQVHELDAAFEGEHSLEVHLPFLQATLERFEIVPLLVGNASGAEVAEVLERLWGGEETLIVVSSDLSHYLDYDSARELDAETTRAIEALEPDALGFDNACGRVPVSGLLLAARRHRLRPTTLDLRNSGDTAGPRSQVVGYGAYAFR